MTVWQKALEKYKKEQEEIARISAAVKVEAYKDKLMRMLTDGKCHRMPCHVCPRYLVNMDRCPNLTKGSDADREEFVRKLNEEYK